jgi:hypothetical protein
MLKLLLSTEAGDLAALHRDRFRRRGFALPLRHLWRPNLTSLNCFGHLADEERCRLCGLWCGSGSGGRAPAGINHQLGPGGGCHSKRPTVPKISVGWWRVVDSICCGGRDNRGNRACKILYRPATRLPRKNRGDAFTITRAQQRGRRAARSLKSSCWACS